MIAVHDSSITNHHVQKSDKVVREGEESSNPSLNEVVGATTIYKDC